MSTIGNSADPTPQIARRVRAEREARGWSLGELATRSGVSKAMLSKIEREQASPSAAVLGRLSAAFQLTLALLLTRAEQGSERLVRARAQPRWRDPVTRYRRRQIFAAPALSPLELVQVELPARASVSYPPAAYTFIRQLVWVTRGTLSVEEGGEQHELRVGDCLAFGAPSAVRFHNPTRASCQYLVVIARV